METIRNINDEFYNSNYEVKNSILTKIKYAFSYDKRFKAKLNYAIIINNISLTLSKNVNVLDYGFGSGKLLLKFYKKCTIFGCESSTAAIKSIKKKIKEYTEKDDKFFLPEEFELKTREKKFDLIICSHVLEHLENDEDIIRMFKNKLKKGGYLYLNLPINEIWKDPKHIREYSKNKVVELLERNYFRIIFYDELNRWSNLILDLDKNKNKKILVKFIKMLLAILPLKLSRSIERIIPSKYYNSYLVVLATNE